jgi:FkbM family methyltransferase
MPSGGHPATLSVAVRPRRFIGDIALPLLPRLRLYDPARKLRGFPRLRRKFGQAGDEIVHGWMKFPARGAFTVNLADGTTGRFDFDAHQSAYLAFVSRALHGGYETTETLFLDAMMAKSRVFYDVGANWGYYTLLGATHPDFNGEICAFDISDQMNAALSRMVEDLRLTTVKVLGYGLSDRSGLAATSADRAAHLTKIIDDADPRSARGARARLARLDDVALPPPDLMKIDVEDLELAVLQGGRRVLARHRPLILFEHRNSGGGGDGAGDAGAYLVSRGYALYGLHRRGGRESVIDLCPIDPDDTRADHHPNIAAIAIGDEARWITT